MADWANEPPVASSVQTTSSFFKNLKSKEKAIADAEARKMANEIVRALKHRQSLNGFGQMPKYSERGSFAGGFGGTSKKAYWKWRVVTNENGISSVYNDARGFGGYSYVRNLAYGTGWAAKQVMSATNGIRTDGRASRLVVNGGRVFSKQLPKGLSPWFALKRNVLKARIKEKT